MQNNKQPPRKSSTVERLQAHKRHREQPRTRRFRLNRSILFPLIVIGVLYLVSLVFKYIQ